MPTLLICVEDVVFEGSKHAVFKGFEGGGEAVTAGLSLPELEHLGLLGKVCELSTVGVMVPLRHEKFLVGSVAHPVDTGVGMAWQSCCIGRRSCGLGSRLH